MRTTSVSARRGCNIPKTTIAADRKQAPRAFPVKVRSGFTSG
jgi:hypothetical protein